MHPYLQRCMKQPYCTEAADWGLEKTIIQHACQALVTSHDMALKNMMVLFPWKQAPSPNSNQHQTTPL